MVICISGVSVGGPGLFLFVVLFFDGFRSESELREAMPIVLREGDEKDLPNPL